MCACGLMCASTTKVLVLYLHLKLCQTYDTVHETATMVLFL